MPAFRVADLGVPLNTKSETFKVAVVERSSVPDVAWIDSVLIATGVVDAVVTVRVDVVAVPVTAGADGENEQLAPAGSPLQASVTEPEKVLVG